MLPTIQKIKGAHPGAVLKRELKRRKVKSKELASAINEYPQTLNAVTQQRRGISAKLSVKLGQYFDIDAAYFLELNAHHQIKRAKQLLRPTSHPLKSGLNKRLFWDTDMDDINWDTNKKYVIQRVLERGSKKEIHLVITYYGRDMIHAIVRKVGPSFVPQTKERINELLEKR